MCGCPDGPRAPAQVHRQKGLHYQPQRSPAWCDRVLFRSAVPGQEVTVLDYFTAPDISTSDHKPVAAILSVPTSEHPACCR
jgi:inositol polyphosphate 5-phosphatase INPP5B/F